MQGRQDLDQLFPDQPDVVEAVIRAEESAEPATEAVPKIKNVMVPPGTYTIVRGDKWKTICVTPWKRRPGWVVFSMLVGPDNGTDFQGFGGQGPDGTFRVWRGFDHRPTWRAAATDLIAIASETDEGLLVAREVYALKSSRCERCHRKLSVPASIHRGRGPECAGK